MGGRAGPVGSGSDGRPKPAQEIAEAERLLRRLALVDGVAVADDVVLGEPLASDESRWLRRAIDDGLVTLGPCPPTCTTTGPHPRRWNDHVTTKSGGSSHLFRASAHGRPVLRREVVPALAAYARAVLELGHPADHAVVFPAAVGRRRPGRGVRRTLAATDLLLGRDGGRPRLQVLALDSRQATRRVATALDVHGSRDELPPPLQRELDGTLVDGVDHLWIVGPNSIDPPNHVFRLTRQRRDLRFDRVDAVPAWELPGRRS